MLGLNGGLDANGTAAAAYGMYFSNVYVSFTYCLCFSDFIYSTNLAVLFNDVNSVIGGTATATTNSSGSVYAFYVDNCVNTTFINNTVSNTFGAIGKSPTVDEFKSLCFFFNSWL